MILTKPVLKWKYLDLKKHVQAFLHRVKFIIEN